MLREVVLWDNSLPLSQFAGFPNKIAFLPQLLASQLNWPVIRRANKFGHSYKMRGWTGMGPKGPVHITPLQLSWDPQEPKCVPWIELSLSGSLPQYPFL